MAVSDPIDLNGKRIVVVEDDYLLATDLCRQLRSNGATVLGPAPTPFYALQLINRTRIDAAVLDIRLHGTTVFEVADRLIEMGVPILFVSAFSPDEVPQRYRAVAWLEKPVTTETILEKVLDLTRRPARPAATVRAVPTSLERPSPAQSFAKALASCMHPA